MAKITLKDGTVIEGTSEEIAELVERFDESDEIKEGDTVELISTDETTLQGFNAGDVCTVTEVYKSVMRGIRLEVYNADNRVGYCSPEKVVKVDVKIEVGDEVILDAGDDEDIRPLIGFYNGETYEVTDMNPEHTDQEGDMISIGYNWGGNEGYPTLDQVKLARKAEDKPEDIEESTKEFNVGDYAKVTGETYNDDILAGAIVKIYREKDVDGDYRIDLVDGSDFDYADAESLEHYEPSDRELSFLRAGRDIDEFKVGDIAEVEYSPGASKKGSLVTIESINGESSVYAEGVNRYYGNNKTIYAYRTNFLKLVATAESRVDIDA